jgi:T5SS/PEP-CTERM-associated repeat protein
MTIKSRLLRSTIAATGVELALVAVFAIGLAVTPASAGTITTGTVSPALGAGSNDVTGSTVNVTGNPGSLEVNGGSNLTADDLRSAGNAVDVTTLTFTGPGTTVNLVGDDPGFTNRIDIGVQGSTSMTISAGAVVDTATAPCISGGCNIFIGNFTGSTGNLTVTGAGSRLDGQDSFVLGQSQVTNIATEGFDAGLAGGVTNGTLNVLDGGVLNTESSTLGTDVGGGGSLGTEQSIVNGTVGGVGSQWNMTGADASLNIARGANATATLNINTGGVVSVSRNATSTASVNVGANGLNGGGDGNLNIDGAGSELAITNTLGRAQLNVASFGDANVTMTNGSQLTISSTATSGDTNINVGIGGTGIFTATDSTIDMTVTGNNVNADAIITIGGTSTTGSAATDGQMTLTNTTLNMTATAGGDVFIGVGRTGGSGSLTVDGGSTVNLSTIAGASRSFVNVGRNNATGTMTVTGIGTTVTMEDFVTIGREAGGDGTLTVSDNATMTATAGIGLTRIGREGGTGALNVTTNAIFNTNNLQVGRDLLSTGTVNVNTGGTINTTDTVAVGRDSATANTLTIGAGSSVNAHSTLVGQNAGSTGTVEMTGIGAQMNLSGLAPNSTIPADLDGASLVVGLRGTGVLNVSAGAAISVTPGVPTGTGLTGGMLIGGSASNPTGTGDGTLTVDGTGSSVIFSNVNGQAGFSQIGRDGTGVLNITNGGLVDGSLQTTAAIGRKIGGSGTVNVTGTGSEWRAGDQVFLGLDVGLTSQVVNGAGGTAVLNVASGGTVTANDIVNGATGTITGGGGTINANIQNSGTIGPGNSPGLMEVIGNVDLLAGGTLAIELGGLIVDTGYDRLDVSAITTIEAGSVFDIDFFGGFTAGLGDSFDILVSEDILVADLGALIFDFSGALLGTGLAWDVSLLDNTFEGGPQDSLRLSVVEEILAVPEPSTLPLFASLLIGIIGIRRAQRKHSAKEI